VESPTTTSLEKALVWHLDKSDCNEELQKQSKKKSDLLFSAHSVSS